MCTSRSRERRECQDKFTPNGEKYKPLHALRRAPNVRRAGFDLESLAVGTLHRPLAKQIPGDTLQFVRSRCSRCFNGLPLTRFSKQQACCGGEIPEIELHERKLGAVVGRGEHLRRPELFSPAARQPRRFVDVAVKGKKRLMRFDETPHRNAPHVDVERDSFEQFPIEGRAIESGVVRRRVEEKNRPVERSLSGETVEVLLDRRVPRHVGRDFDRPPAFLGRARPVRDVPRYVVPFPVLEMKRRRRHVRVAVDDELSELDAFLVDVRPEPLAFERETLALLHAGVVVSENDEDAGVAAAEFFPELAKMRADEAADEIIGYGAARRAVECVGQNIAADKDSGGRGPLDRPEEFFVTGRSPVEIGYEETPCHDRVPWSKLAPGGARRRPQRERFCNPRSRLEIPKDSSVTQQAFL